ncbi:protein takeout-like [Microplitis mediator]|uniref:protein takeout-like n=1 Tax=Microplitis mediator TaxID=375433 RepID=UPI002552AA17|nr:protein takeout-like [Microplitis mediator]
MSQWKLLILLSLLTISKCVEVPSFLKICHRSDLHLNECVKHSVEAIKPRLRVGIKELNIPSCEPLKISKINISQSAATIAVKFVCTNILINGGTHFVLKKVNIDFDKNQIQLKIFFPRLSMTSDYDINGRIMMIPIRGQGQCQGNFSEINADIMIQGERYENNIDKKIYFKIKDVLTDFDVGHANMNLDNSFNRDKTLALGMNTFLRDNWKTVAVDMKPAIGNNIADLVKKYSEEIFSKYPLDLLLPL